MLLRFYIAQTVMSQVAVISFILSAGILPKSALDVNIYLCKKEMKRIILLHPLALFISLNNFLNFKLTLI